MPIVVTRLLNCSDIGDSARQGVWIQSIERTVADEGFIECGMCEDDGM
jgi:hypothetical protein